MSSAGQATEGEGAVTGTPTTAPNGAGALITDELFPELPPDEKPEKLSADRRRTQRQRDDIARGVHPLTGSPLADEPEAKCGNCRFRELFDHRSKSYPKCTYGDTLNRVTHSASSDVRAWWPGCNQHEWGDSKLSPDAMRSGPAA